VVAEEDVISVVVVVKVFCSHSRRDDADSNKNNVAVGDVVGDTKPRDKWKLLGGPRRVYCFWKLSVTQT